MMLRDLTHLISEPTACIVINILLQYEFICVFHNDIIIENGKVLMNIVFLFIYFEILRA